MIANRAGWRFLTRHERGLFSVDAVYRSMDRAVAARLARHPDRLSAVYAYEDGAFDSFAAAKAKGIACIYDLPIGHWRTMRRLLEAERSRWPEWAVTLGGFNDSEEKLARKDRELRLADLIVVASSFTARSLGDFPEKLNAPVITVPYGFPLVLMQPKSAPVLTRTRPLKLLFVGGLSQRKGIADVFAVADRLQPHVELTVVGHKPAVDCPELARALRRHRWIPSLPHGEILKLMHSHDLLLFPSLFEGFGLVITEAMSQGTPVITTDRTAGPDLLTSGQDGWIFPAGSTEALQATVEHILHNLGQLASVGREALATAGKRPWSVYGVELVKGIVSFMGGGSP